VKHAETVLQDMTAGLIQDGKTYALKINGKKTKK